MSETCERNKHKRFDKKIENKLKCYVYVLRDPGDGKIFYVGKAGGKGEGNSRVLAHFDEAREACSKPCGSLEWSPKISRIIEIWKAGQEVDWFIVRHGLDAVQAQHVEAALIDALEVSQNGPTLNLQRGHGTDEHGLLWPSDVYAIAAMPVCPGNDYPAVLLFPIQNALKSGRNVYAATRCCWNVSLKKRRIGNPLAIGIRDQISMGVFEVDQWNQSLLPKKYEFDGRDIGSGHELMSRNYNEIIQKSMGYWQRGNYLGIEFKQINRKPHFRFFHGSSDTKQWHSL